jgi:hypothetical protein
MTEGMLLLTHIGTRMQQILANWRMFHDLLTIRVSFKQFTHFNGVFQGFLSKNLFLCTRETMCEPNAMKVHFRIAEAKPLLINKHILI